MEQISKALLTFDCPDCNTKIVEQLPIVNNSKTKGFKSFWCPHCGGINKIEFKMEIAILMFESGKDKKKPDNLAVEF